MTLFEVFVIVQAIVMAIVASIVATLKWGMSGGTVLARLTTLEERMDTAGRELSDLTTDVQGLPERMRGTFMPLDRAADFVRESKDDRLRLQSQIDFLLGRH